jgi:P-type E1-E2 ATPase
MRENINIKDLESPERDLKILGCTGMEDVLQDGVIECIQDFKNNAGLKVWMLTGDKGETAT